MTGTDPAPDWVEHGRAVLTNESEALAALCRRLDRSFATVVELMLACDGKVIVTGMGKSGAVARKIAGTLSSTGTPSLYLHPGEGIHGDLGVLTATDLLVALSQSGETDELLAILPAVKRIGARIVALTGAPASTLARLADVTLDTSVEREACPMNLAPTTSAVCQMALGDALAMCAMQARRFSEADYARYHPGGSLGRRLLLRTSDLMRTGDAMAVVTGAATVKDALFAITRAGAGAAIVVDDGGRLEGLITDGDLRRYLLRGDHALSAPVADAMTRNPTVTTPDGLAAEIVGLIDGLYRERGIQIGEVPVVDPAGRPVGILMLKDVARAGIAG